MSYNDETIAFLSIERLFKYVKQYENHLLLYSTMHFRCAAKNNMLKRGAGKETFIQYTEDPLESWLQL